MAAILGWFCCSCLAVNPVSTSVMRDLDSEENPYIFDSRPHRLVCLVPEITGILIAIDADDARVGITKHTRDPAVSGKIRVGGFLSPEIRRIEDFDPDLIIAADLHHSVREHFREKCPFLTMHVFSIDDALKPIGLLGRIFNRGRQLKERYPKTINCPNRLPDKWPILNSIEDYV